MQIIRTDDKWLSRDETILLPVEIHVHGGGHIVACYDGQIDQFYSSWETFREAHDLLCPATLREAKDTSQ